MSWLTAEEKEKTVAEWLSYRSSHPAPEGLEAGYGFPDPAIFLLTDALNVMSGICTTQSCSGHLHLWETPEMQSMWSGQLWLRCSQLIFSEFMFFYVEDLLKYPTIEGASIHWHKGEEDWPVLDIMFDGLNRSKEALEESSTVIIEFFTMLTKSERY